MKRIFITGMGRSGTSLLDKLLCAHPDVDILSQPFPLVFVEAKRRFLKKIGVSGYYVLNDDKISRDYPDGALAAYLAKWEMSVDQVEELFREMAGYSGQKTKPERKPAVTVAQRLESFDEILEYCLQYFELRSPVTYAGMKEVMCEEFLPYLGTAGYKCIVIIRDPRDVLASANYPTGEKFLGAKKPALLLLRAWRKSVEFSWTLRREPFLHYLRYEDLVKDPMKELGRIVDFLEVGCFEDRWLEGGIRDRAGKPWLGNSSSGIPGMEISSASVGTHRQRLSEREIAYTESVCAHEMAWLGYSACSSIERAACIEGFRDYDVEEQPELSSDFSSRPEHVEQELRRLQDFEGFYSCR